MIGRNAVFVDLSSLNVVFKLDTKFVVALNYGSAIDRLGEVITSLGTGYDVYLCLKPRAEGSGDIVLEELSMVGMPFTADTTELYRVLTFFRESNGVGEVYLCNWLHNFIAMSRVASFKSAFYYGDKVAAIEVKDRMLERFALYDSQYKFTETVGEDYGGYGDLGLIDVDGLKAQYPELRDGSKAQLTAIAPLVQAYRSPMKMKTDDLYDKLKAKFRDGVEIPAVEPRPVVEPRPMPEDPQVTPVTEEIPEPPKVEKAKPIARPEPEVPVRRRKTPAFAKVLLVACALLSFTLGACAHVVMNPADTVNQSYFDEADARIRTLQTLSNLYGNASTNMDDVVAANDYIRKSGLAVTITGFEFGPNGNVVRCACASKDIATSFTEYIGKQYRVDSTNDLGTSGTPEQPVYQYSITFMKG